MGNHNYEIELLDWNKIDKNIVGPVLAAGAEEVGVHTAHAHAHHRVRVPAHQAAAVVRHLE